MDIREYVLYHTTRGECRCGKCLDKGNSPDPVGHVVNIGFFTVGLSEYPADVETFKKLTAEHAGDFGEMNPLDGKEHSYIELGGWIGDQGLAMQYMALGTLLGVFDLLTPWTMLPFLAEEQKQQMAGMGMINIRLASVKSETAEVSKPA